MNEQIKKWIVHLDMDAFFASVEQLDHPEYRGKAIIIGGGRRGVVSTCSYEARKFGVRSAMPVFMAQKLCPHGIMLPGRRERYVEKSREIMKVLHNFSPLVEQASIDEAYLDATGLGNISGSIEEFLQTVQKSLLEQTGLTASLGAAPIKFLAKIASDMKKPAGISIITHEEMPAFLQTLPINKIPGVGKQTLPLLESLGVQKAGDMLRFPQEFWARRLGKAGEALYAKCTGNDHRPVEPYVEAKSESAENTFEHDTKSHAELSAWLLRQADRVGAELRRKDVRGRTITLKIKYSDFSQVTRSKTIASATHCTRTIYGTALELLEAQPLSQMVRLIGVGVSNFGEKPQQLSLLGNTNTVDEERELALDHTLDMLRQKFGSKALIRGKLFRIEKD